MPAVLDLKCGGPGSGIPGPCPIGGKGGKVGNWDIVGNVVDTREHIVPNKKIPPDSDEAKALFKQGLESIEKLGIRKQIYLYAEGAYKWINSTLRGRPPKFATEQTHNTVHNFASNILKGSVDLPHGMYLSRSHSGDISKLTPGIIVSDKAILSTSIMTMKGKNVWHLSVGANVRGFPISSVAKFDEKEVLLPANQKIMVTKTEKKKDGGYSVYGMIMPTELNNKSVKIHIAKSLIQIATKLADLRTKKLIDQFLRNRAEKIHTAQREKLEDALTDALVPLFNKQINDAVGRLASGSKAFCPTGTGGGVNPHCGNSGFSPSKAKVTIEDSDKVDRASNELMGRKLSSEEYASIVGASDTAKVHVLPWLWKGSMTLRITVSDDPVYATRYIKKDNLDKTIIENDIITIKEGSRGTGIGTDIFNRQVHFAANAGIEYIKCKATKGSRLNANGYYTWPRLGYDGPLSESIAKKAKRKLGIIAKNVSDLMRTEDGRQFWKENGSTFDAKFDLKEGSQSRRVLDAYVKERAARGTTGSKSGGRGGFGRDLGRDWGRDWSGRKAGPRVDQIFNARDYDEELINRALPPIAQAMAEAMMAQALQMKDDARRMMKSVKCGGPGSGVPGPCPQGGQSKIGDGRYFYHGTPDKESAERIQREGLRPNEYGNPLNLAHSRELAEYYAGPNGVVFRVEQRHVRGATHDRMTGRSWTNESIHPSHLEIVSPKKAFCPTGPGGGVNNTCKPGTSGPKGTGTKQDPIRCGADIDCAANHLAQGNHIRLDQPHQVSTLLDKLYKEVQKSVALGEKAPAFDLCKVSVPKTNLFCVDEETEILTIRGWASYCDLKIGDTVLTLNHESGLSEWQEVSAVNILPFEKRTVLRMEGKLHSSLTTLDHRWPIIKEKRRLETTRQWTTSERLGNDDSIVIGAFCSNLPKKAIYSNSFVELIAWSWTEGTISKSGVDFRLFQSHVKNEIKCGLIRAACENVFGSAHIGSMNTVKAAVKGTRGGVIRKPRLAWREIPNNDNGVTTFLFNRPASKEILRHLNSDKSVKPGFIASLTEFQLRLFVERSIDANGGRADSAITIGQRSEARIRSFEMACALLGIPTNTRMFVNRVKKKIQYSTTLRRSVKINPKAASSTGRSFVMEKVPYIGIMWCPTTPNHTWLARRRGSVYYTGNCNETIGVPRAQMPQMRGIPIEGSEASKLKRNKKGKVDIGDQFIDDLRSNGIKVKEEKVRASHLRASQNEIDGARVAQLVKEEEHGQRDLRERPIFITKDDYVLDGHHHWAAIVGRSYQRDKDLKVPVYRVDMGIGEAIWRANDFAGKMGIAPKSVPKSFDPEKAFCPTGPGGGVDPTCSSGTGGSAGKSQYITGKSDPDVTAILKRGSEKKFLDSITTEEAKALSEWKGDDPYAPGAAVALAGMLREGHQLSDAQKTALGHIDSAFGKSPRLKASTTLYRGTFELMRTHKIGDLDYVETKAPMSTSVRKDEAENFASLMGGAGYIYEIKVPKGFVAMPTSHFHGHSTIAEEGELLLPRNASMKITGRSGRVIQVEVIGGEHWMWQRKEVHLYNIKASTATEWLESLDDDDAQDLEDVVFKTPYGNITMKLATDYPEWMKEKIQERLDESFSQPYWKEINDTTAGDINGFLSNALKEGLSIEDMAREMRERYGGDDYPLSRGRNIARTEAGGALNSVRSDAIDGLLEDLGLEDVAKKVWLSVLGNTTRDTHAHLDGVPASEDGTWALGGVRCRWPGDIRLPAGERCQCQCSVYTQLGMQNDEAAELIADYDLRNKMAEEFYKSFCPTGLGGGVDPHCSPGKTSAGFVPGSVGKDLGVDTSKWKQGTVHAQWTMKYLSKLEEYAKDGKYGEGMNLFHQLVGLPQKYKAAVEIARESFKKKLGSHLQDLPPSSKPSLQPGAAAQTGWTKIGGQLGTNPGGTYTGPDEKKYYVKQPDNPDHARSEVLALKLYELAGADTVKGHLVEIDGKLSVATEWLNTTKSDWGPGALGKTVAGNDFAAHAWLNNWDAAGAGHEHPMENIQLRPGGPFGTRAVLVDAGGSLDFKATGGKKPFTHDASEWDNLRDPNINPSAAHIFGGMTPKQLKDSAEKSFINTFGKKEVEDLVNKYGNGGAAEKMAMVDTLLARRDAIIVKSAQLPGFSTKTEAQIAAMEVTKPPATNPVKHASVPPPPNVINTELKKGKPLWTNLQDKYNQIYQHAKNGNIAEIEKIKVKADAVFYGTKQLADYKAQVLGALKGGGKANPDHVAPPSVKEKSKIDLGKLPAVPEFTSKNATNVEANKKLAEEAHDHAAKGDLIALQSMALSTSPKLKEYHTQLVNEISNQLNPPPPPTKLSDDYLKYADGLPTKASDGVKKIGYWAVLGQVPNVAPSIPAGVWKSGYEGNEELWKSGKKAAEDAHIIEYAKSHQHSSSSFDHDLRKGITNTGQYKIATKFAKAIIEKGVTLPEGQMLSRKYGGPSSSQSKWDNVKPGTVISEKGNICTSTSDQVWAGVVQLKLMIGPGVKGLPVAGLGYKNEEQVTLPAGQRIMITKIDHYKNKAVRIVHGVILPTLPAQCCPP